MTAADLVQISGVWLMIGAGVCAVFLLFGIDRIDEDADGAYVFRPLLIPGILLIWPLVLWRWVRLESGTGEAARRFRPPRAVHLPVAVIMAVALAIAVITSLSIRQSWPAHIKPEQISEPGS